MGKVLLVVLVFAVVTYLVTRAMQRVGDTPVSRRPHMPNLRPRPRPRPKPLAPDDDEDFLRDLDRKRRRQDPPEDA